jgi:hypothetical protein
VTSTEVEEVVVEVLRRKLPAPPVGPHEPSGKLALTVFIEIDSSAGRGCVNYLELALIDRIQQRENCLIDAVWDERAGEIARPEGIPPPAADGRIFGLERPTQPWIARSRTTRVS